MRLVKLDEVINELHLAFEEKYAWDWDNVIVMLADLKEVEAIPIEWIEHWLTKQSIPATSYGIDYSAVEKMLEDWEKENEHR